MTDRIDINESFRQSIQKRIEDINIDMSEIVLDSFINDEILKEIPIIKSVVSLTNVGVNIKNQFLIRKLYRFLFELNSVTPEERTKFINRLENDKTKKNIYNNLFIIIDRIDTEEKIPIMSKILKAMILEKVDISIGFRLFNVIEKAYVDDLLSLNKRYGTNRFSYFSDEYWFDVVKESLFNLGLLSPIFGDNSSELRRMPRTDYKIKIKEYDISSLGRILIENGF